jgi:hypothetical protein
VGQHKKLQNINVPEILLTESVSNHLLVIHAGLSSEFLQRADLVFRAGIMSEDYQRQTILTVFREAKGDGDPKYATYISNCDRQTCLTTKTN